MSASTIVRKGPGSRRDRSRTRTPDSASANGEITSLSLRTSDFEQLLQLHRQHRIAGDAQLALEVELHAGVRVRQHGLEVLARDFDRALRLAGIALRAGRWVGGAVDRPLATTVAG